MYALLRLRQEVFVVEQDCVYLDADGGDLDALHLLGWSGEDLVACIRIAKRAEWLAIQRVITAPSHRGIGLGRALMARGLEEAARLGPDLAVTLSAQAHLRRFYESFGFVVSGPGYDEDGIPHLPMRRARD